MMSKIFDLISFVMFTVLIFLIHYDCDKKILLIYSAICIPFMILTIFIDVILFMKGDKD